MPEGGWVALLEDVVTTGGTLIKVIERERLQALLSEMRLGMTGIVDQATATVTLSINGMFRSRIGMLNEWL